MKKIFILLMAVIMVTSGSVVVKAEDDFYYQDVDSDAYYYDSVSYMKEIGLMTGKDDVHFAPDDYIERQDLAVILYRHYLMKKDMDSELQLSDPLYYKRAIEWAKEYHIMLGYENGDFGIGDSMTREDFILALYRHSRAVLGYGYSLSHWPEVYEIQRYKDFRQITDYAYWGMHWLAQSKVIRGYEVDGEKIIDPQGYVTRGMAAEMLTRYLNKYDVY